MIVYSSAHCIKIGFSSFQCTDIGDSSAQCIKMEFSSVQCFDIG